MQRLCLEGSTPFAVYKLHVLWRSATSLRFSAALGIARTSSALHSLARKFAAARQRPSKLGLCRALHKRGYVQKRK